MSKLTLAAALSAALCFASCGEGKTKTDPAPKTNTKTTSDAMKMAKFELEKSPWGGCVATVRGALDAIPGIGEIQIQKDVKAFSVQYDPAKTDPQKLLAAVNATPDKCKLVQ